MPVTLGEALQDAQPRGVGQRLVDDRNSLEVSRRVRQAWRSWSGCALGLAGLSLRSAAPHNKEPLYKRVLMLDTSGDGCQVSHDMRHASGWPIIAT